MLLTLAALLLGSSPPHSPPAEPPPRDECEEIRHLELSLPTAATQRICVSPGIMTGLLFDHPVVVEFEDEARFIEITRGRTGISFVPPQDMLLGEQLRLTASLQVGEQHQSVTFALISHPGQATHQVEVHGDKRTWQSLHDELNQAWLMSKRLKEENDTLKAELEQTRLQLALSTGLRGTYLSGELDWQRGIVAHVLDMPKIGETRSNELSAVGATSYRGRRSVAVAVAVLNATQEPWMLENATLINSRGETLVAIRIWQPETLLPNNTVRVFVEFETDKVTSGPAMLKLEESRDARVISIPNVVFP